MGMDTRVTPSLHPQNIASMDEYDDESALVLEPTLNLFTSAYAALSNVHEAREAAKTNPVWNDDQQVLETAAFAEKQMTRVIGAVDNVSKNLQNGINSLERELNTSVTAKASASVSAEIRAHMKGLPTTQALGFLKQAIDKGDVITASAILGAPSYLSGITPEMQAVYLRMYNEKEHAPTAKRLRSFKAALAMIEDRSPLLHREFEKAVGMPRAKVEALRSARTKAERAFIMRDA